jgi:hypothetical protein
MTDVPSPLDFLRAAYLNNDLPLSTRMRAASLCLPFVHPKLAVTAEVTAGDPGDMLDRAIARSLAGPQHNRTDGPKLIEGKWVETDVPPINSERDREQS